MDDILTIRDRLTSALAGGAVHLPGGRQSPVGVRAVVDGQAPDGSWPDIDYADRQRSTWQPLQHLRRTIVLLQAAAAVESQDHLGEALRQAARRALHYWVTRRPESDNWWHNDIGAPTALADVLLLLGDAVDASDRAQALDIVRGVAVGKTGQNRAWLASIAFRRGLLESDAELVRRALEEVLGEVRVTTAPEGIQPDWSFRQHGPQFHQGNYGASFPDTCAPYATLLDGTHLAMMDERVEVLCRLLLEGTQWLTWGSRMDYHSLGRFISHPERSRWESRMLRDACVHLAQVSPAHREALLAFHDRLLEKAPPAAGAPVGNRHFWRSDIMVHRRESFYASVRMSSLRTVRSEACNGEGLCNYHLGDGVTLFLRKGCEYDGIFPVWDWRRLPGVTCRQDAGALPVLSTGRDLGTTEFVGGVSDGLDGLAALDYALDGVSARKVWFCMGDTILCLGAGIHASSGRIATSVNQCLQRGSVAYAAGDGRSTLATGHACLQGSGWVYHDGIGYLLLGDERVVLACQEQVGSWQSINSNMPDELQAETVFSLWIDHGESPADARYAYAVCLGVDAAATAVLAHRSPWQVSSNTSAVQAVWTDDLFLAAFYQPGSVQLPFGAKVAVDSSCLLMVRCKEGVWQLSVAEPSQTRQLLRIVLDGCYEGEACSYSTATDATTVEVALPVGGDAGRSILLSLEPRSGR